jgi:hypothetical protein
VRVGGHHVGATNLKIGVGHNGSLILGVPRPCGRGFIRSLQTLLLARFVVLDVVDPATPIYSE